MRIAQVVVAAAPHDAITSHALALQGALAEMGESSVYARHVDAAMADRVGHLRDLATTACDAIVFHASIGEHDVTEFLLGRTEPLVLVYHNITPAEFFDEVDPGFAELLRAGRRELAALRDRTALALGVSEYNAAELRDAGFGAVGVSPLVVGTERLAGPPDPATQAALEEAGGPVFVFVGQLLPHKRPDFLVQAFHILRTYLEPGSGLVLAGPSRRPAYAAALHQFVAELALPDVWLTGPVSDAVLAALYRGADAFVTASEHEGFCVPLVEAMTAGLPVLARRFAAVPDTLGGAGLVLEPEDGPAVFAEAMLAVASDEGLRGALVATSRRRASELSAVDAPGAFVAHVRSVL